MIVKLAISALRSILGADLPKPNLQPYAAHITFQHTEHQGIEAKYAGSTLRKAYNAKSECSTTKLDREEYRVTRFHAVVALIAMLTSSALAADSTKDVSLIVPEFAKIQPDLEALYRDLHQHPEIAFHEIRLPLRVRSVG